MTYLLWLESQIWANRGWCNNMTQRLIETCASRLTEKQLNHAQDILWDIKFWK
jgi:hypothetical protein